MIESVELTQITDSVLPPPVPVIKTQPNSANIYSGVYTNGSIVFTATVIGATPLYYQPRTPILPGATNLTMTLNNIQPAQAGNYTLIMTNAYGSTASSNAVLQVISAGLGAATTRLRSPLRCPQKRRPG